jgi:hypothetical protein
MSAKRTTPQWPSVEAAAAAAAAAVALQEP